MGRRMKGLAAFGSVVVGLVTLHLATGVASSNFPTPVAVAAAASGSDPTLTLVVHLVNPGDITPADYTLMAMSPAFTFAGAGGSANVTEIAVPDATYRLSISGPGGGSPSVWSCLGVDTFTTNSVTLADGDIATCSITVTFAAVTTTTTAPATTTTTAPATTTTTAPTSTTTAPPETTTTATTLPGSATTLPEGATTTVPPKVPGEVVPVPTTEPPILVTGGEPATTLPLGAPITAPPTPAPGCPVEDPQCPSSGRGLG